ncbi:MAG: Ig-like domain-containing protein, partial [Dokdonella sp.]
MPFERGAVGATLCLAFVLAAPPALAQTVSLVGGVPAVQDFNTLAASGSSSTLPDGWYLAENGNNANTTYSTSNGSANAGDTYSFGTNSDRALGMLRSGSLAPMIGARLRNDTELALSEIAVSFAGEQWRLGTAGRSDRIAAQYSLDATSLGDSAATWVNIAALDFTSPVSSGTTGALDGNAAANRSAIAASISGLDLAPNASVWLRWVDMDASGADDGLAIDDITFAVAGDPPVDIPPTIAGTTPANNATGVAPGATLAVAFSEAVATSDPWFTLVCATSGSHTASISGGPTSFTLTPSPAFAPNESCTWGILASGIVDLDGTPDHPAADTLVTFQTLDPTTAPPSVVSIAPADGASHVPVASDVHVTFSEAVTTTANAFALACDAAPITLSETGTGALRTLTPATVLPAGANCTFAISANEVHNGFDVPLAADVTSHFSINNSGGGVGNYYAHVNTGSPDQLRCSLHLTIRGHTAYPYSGSGTTTWTILEL